MTGDMFKRFRGKSSSGNGSGKDFTRLREAEILAAVDRLPALPEIANRILSKSNDGHTNASDLQKIIMKDMVISGRLLKLVNSPFYSLPNTVSSIQQAVAIVGMRSLRSLVVAASTSEIMRTDVSAYGFEPKGLWVNSMATAGLTAKIAEILGIPQDEADIYFVAGLLRDIGMLVIAPIMKKMDVDLVALNTGDILNDERSALYYDHCWAGEQAAKKWDLNDDLTFVISKHHRIPTDCEPNRLRLLASVRLAEGLIYKAGVGLQEKHAFNQTVDKVLIKTVGLNSEQFKKVIEQMPSIIEAASLDTE